MLKKGFLLACSLLFSTIILAQGRYTISGYIKSESTGETLIGASVYIKEISNGALTNAYGFYSISLPPGTYNLEYSYFGYNTIDKVITLEENTKLDVELAETNEKLEEIVVVSEAEDANVTDIQMSVNKLNINTIQRMPALLGEVGCNQKHSTLTRCKYGG